MAKKGSKITGLKALRQNFNKLSKQAAKDGGKISVIVGYKAKYALNVHEMTKMTLKGKPRADFGKTKAGVSFGGGTGKGKYWDPQGKAQAKFLEAPARDKTVQGIMQKVVIASMKRVPDMKIALVAAGGILQKASMKLVPVDTGNLKDSAFTELE